MKWDEMTDEENHFAMFITIWCGRTKWDDQLDSLIKRIDSFNARFHSSIYICVYAYIYIYTPW